MKVLITDPIAKEGVEILKREGFQVDEKPGIPKEELIATIPEYDAIIVRSATKVTREVIEAAKKLRVIGRAGVGLDNIDREAAKERGIKVLNTPEATSISVAELSLAMMFANARPLVEGTTSLKQGKWEKKRLKGFELYGKTLGIIGIGRIGKELAKRAKALGMRVLAYDPYVSSSDVAELTTLDNLLKESDFISIHTPLTDETRHLISREEFEKMKDGVVLINCARGGIVDEDALYEALKSGKVKSAGIDVYEKEPPIGNRLLELENVVLTPHIGAQTSEGQKRAGIGIAELVRDTLKGR